MLPAAARASSPDPDERRIDVEPPGFGGFYGAGLATALMSAVMVLPLALIGMFGAAFWHDSISRCGC